MIRLMLMSLAFFGTAQADSLVAARTVRAHAVLTEADITLVSAALPGAASNPADVIGLETRVALYKGRPILPDQLSAPAIIERNAAVMLAYKSGPVTILAEGRALARGGAGEWIRVMNIASRTMLTGRIGPDGTVYITP